jgi:NTE family protein
MRNAWEALVLLVSGGSVTSGSRFPCAESKLLSVVHPFRILLLLISCVLGGCSAAIYTPHNAPITRVDPDAGYRAPSSRREKELGDHMILLAFSGGGTRAAALSYGVLEELRDTTIDADGARIRVLDEVDTISSVSGGSFTAAYYGLFGDDIFKNYEKDFLRQSIQSTLIRKLFNPVYWWKALFSGFNRTEMAVEYYDKEVFHKKTFADIPLDERPFIEINATDLGTGSRFSFAQGMFDIICSDLESFSVSRAVTASSAVPIAFPPVVLKNYAGGCGFKPPHDIETSDSTQHLFNRVAAWQDAKRNAYLHLVDGGISDNLGLRAMLDRVDYVGGVLKSVNSLSRVPKDVLIVLVNAAVAPARPFSESPGKPSLRETIGAISSAQIDLYSKDTMGLLRDRLAEYQGQLSSIGHSMPVYFVEVSFTALTSPGLQEFFNSLPTSLELSKEQVDSLIKGGRELLRENPEFKAFVKANNTAPIADQQSLGADPRQLPCLSCE